MLGFFLFLLIFISSAHFVRPFSENEHIGPLFISEPPSLVEFLNTTGVSIQCIAHGIPEPIVEWITADDNLPVKDVPNIRRVLPNNTLVFYPFGPNDYLSDIHATTYKCAVTNIGGSIVSRDVRVRAAVKQDYQTQVIDKFVIRGNTVVMTCQIPNFVEEFIIVTSWLRDETVTIVSDMNDVGKYSMLPNGELHVRNVSSEDNDSRFRCRTKHRLTGETKLSRTYGKIHVREPPSSVAPTLVDGKFVLKVKTGEMAELSCAAQGFPIPEYTWFIKSPVGKLIRVQSNRRITIKGGLIRFSEALMDDSNVYECMVNNSMGMGRKEMVLIVTEPLMAKVEPKVQEVDVGGSSTFNCEVTGYPVDSITWIKDTKPVFADGVRIRLEGRQKLYISSLQREDKGMYQCFVYNKYESAQSSAQLKLGDAAPVLLDKFEERILQPGPSVSLKCIASGSPLPEIKWTLDGVDLPKNERISVGDFIVARNGDITSHVNISNVRAEDGGFYQCTAKNRISSVHFGARLNIFGVPFIREMDDRLVLSGNTLFIQCPVAGYPIKQIVWQRGGKSLPENHAQKVFTNGTLMVKNVQPGSDAGQYTCIARNRQGQSARKTVNVKVAVPPLIDSMSFPRKLRLVKSRRRSIHCTVVLGDSPISVNWEKDGKPIEPDRDLMIRNFESESTLLIRSATSKHNGTYTCIAKNSAATVSRTVVVIVDVPPSWTVEPKDISVALGSTAYLDCMAGGAPEPLITWRRSTEQEFETIYNIFPFEIFNNGTLAVKNITEDLGGRYLCQASNDIGKPVSKVVAIDIRIPAYFQMKTRNQTVRKNDDAILQCEGFGDPPLTIVWNRNATPLDAKSRKRYMIKGRKTERGQVSELVIKRSERKDKAKFMCRISNTFGSDEMTINLVVLESPDPVTELSVKSINSRQVELAWKHPFDGNSPITKYIIHYKNQSSEWDNGQASYKTTRGTFSKIKLTKLRPNSKYDARITAENEEGTSPSSEEVKFSTSEDNPEGPPKNVTIDVIGSRTLKISWLPPDRLYWNGRLKGYHVSYKKYGSSKSYKSQTLAIKNQVLNDMGKVKYSISGLDRDTKYEINIKAFNSAGVGPRSTSVFATTLAKGVGLYPPNKPSLSVLSVRHNSLTLKWDLEVTEDRPVREYILHYMREKIYHEMLEFNANNLNNSIVVDGLKCGTKYTFNLTAHNGMGAGKSSNTLKKSTSGTAPKPAEKEVFISANATFIALDMSAWNLGGCPLLSLLVEYKLKNNKIWTESARMLSPRKDTVVYVTELKPQTDYRIKVIAENDAGVGAEEYDVKTSGTGLITSSSDFFSLDMTFVFAAVGLIALIVIILVIVSICLCLKRKKHPAEKNAVRKTVNGNNNNKKKVELPDVPGPVKKKSNGHQQNNRPHTPPRQNSATYENTASNLIYCPKDEELMPYAKMVLGAKMEDSENGTNGQVEFKTFYMKAGARRTDPPPLPPRDDSLATKIATLRRNPRPPGSHRYPGAGSEETGDESDIYRDPEDSELPPPPAGSLSRGQSNPSNKQLNGHGSLNHKAQNLSMDNFKVPTTLNNAINGSPFYSNTPPPLSQQPLTNGNGNSANISQTGVYTNFPPPPPLLSSGELEMANPCYSNSSIIAQHQAGMLANPHYQMVAKKPRRFVPDVTTNSFRRPSIESMERPTMKNPPPPSQLRASSNALSSSEASENEGESRDHIATRLHKEILGARNSNKVSIPQSVV